MTVFDPALRENLIEVGVVEFLPCPHDELVECDDNRLFCGRCEQYVTALAVALRRSGLESHEPRPRRFA